MQNYQKIIKNLKSEEIDLEYERIRSQSKNRSYSSKNSEAQKNLNHENISLKNRIYILQEQLSHEKQRSDQLENTIKKLKVSMIEQDKDLLAKCEQKITTISEKDKIIKQQADEINVLKTEMDLLKTNIAEFQQLEITINSLTQQYNQIAPNLQDQQQILQVCLHHLQSLSRLIDPLLSGTNPELQDLFQTKLKYQPKKKFQISELCNFNFQTIQKIEQMLVNILEQIDQKYINEFSQYLK